ncbi:hypothetical protein TNCV_3271231 [Trichonephila clavipes]|nr:hypothetical protein TNCV_3271231 [Trichonephila clavipes]
MCVAIPSCFDSIVEWDTHVSSLVTIRLNFDDKNEMSNAALVPIATENRNIIKSMRSYLDVHSNEEMNNKMEQFVDNLMLKKTMQRKISDYIPKT